MKTERTNNYVEFQSSDSQGEFYIRIFKDCSQLQLKSGDDDAFIETNKKELTAIRDLINEVLQRTTAILSELQPIEDAFELHFCEKCMQMTNHLDGICQKCKPKCKPSK